MVQDSREAAADAVRDTAICNIRGCDNPALFQVYATVKGHGMYLSVCRGCYEKLPDRTVVRGSSLGVPPRC